jgi:peptide/nickel transport system substrate-binding protein
MKANSSKKEVREGGKMKGKKWAALLSVFVLMASLVAYGLRSVRSEQISKKEVAVAPTEFPRNESMILGGDTSYCGMGFNPYNIPGSSANRGGALTYMSLFWYNWTSGELQPWLAKSYEWSVDGSKFVIHLRPEARWRDGTPVTADDVVFDFETENESGRFPLEPTIIESVTAANTSTVDINLVAGKEFSNRVLISLQDMPVFSKVRWQALLAQYGDITSLQTYRNENFDQIDGSGPYLPIVSEPNRVVYERVDNWWGNETFGQPAPKYVILLNHATNDLEQRDFDQGVLDWDDSFFSGSYAYIINHNDTVCWNKKDINGKVFNTAGAIYLVPNIGSKVHPELSQPWLRQAVAYAIDVDQIISVAQEGLVVRASPSYITPTGPMADAYIDHNLINQTYGAEYIPHDPAKAIQILQEHCNGSVDQGWTWNGNPIGPWQINTISGWSDVNLMSWLITQQLKNIGITMQVNMIDESIAYPRAESMDFDWLDFDFSIDTSPSPTFPISGLDSLFRGEPGADVDMCNYTSSPNSQAVNDLILSMWSLPIGSNESIAVAKQIQALLVPELPYIPLYVQIPWSRYHTDYWVGWPTVDNPGPGQGASWWEPTIVQVIFGLQSAQKATVPTGGVPVWVWVGTGVVVVAIIAAVALVMTRKRSKK